jgi:hypothetical protein
MGKQYATIDAALMDWVQAQPLFFVATAPSGDTGHVNLSPKGSMDTFRVLDPTTVAYLDLVGSGVETIAHLRQNGRITIMACAFSGPPRIVRLYGQGRVVEPHDAEFADLVAQFAPSQGVRTTLRSVIVVVVERVGDSCGFVVPRMKLVDERQQLFRWAETKAAKRGAGWEQAYQRANNRVSIDGLPGLDTDQPPTPADISAHSSVGKKL